MKCANKPIYTYTVTQVDPSAVAGLGGGVFFYPLYARQYMLPSVAPNVLLEIHSFVTLMFPLVLNS